MYIFNLYIKRSMTYIILFLSRSLPIRERQGAVEAQYSNHYAIRVAHSIPVEGTL